MQWLAGIAVLAFAALAGVYVLWRRRRIASEGLASFESALRMPSPPPESGPIHFHPVLLAELPEPAARYLRWSLADGVPVRHGVHLKMTGRIRLGRSRPWLPLRCEEVYHARRGFVWKASTRNLLRIAGFDRYARGQGRMYWTLFGLIPVLRASGPDVSRSARERFVAERMLAPASLLPSEDVEWRALNENCVVLRIREQGEWLECRLIVDPDGMPRKLTFPRWGNLESSDGQWREIPYSVRFEGVFRAGGYSLPHEWQASWWSGTDRELSVADLEIEQAAFFD